MPLDTPSYDQIVERMRADIANELPDIDPTIYGSFVSAFAVSNAGRHYDNVLLLEQLVRELFPQTATDEFLEMWAQYEGLSRLPASAATGNITVTGVASTAVPVLTEWRTADNKIVVSLSGVNLSLETISISSLTRSGTTVTGTTASDHTFATGMEITIAGAVETDYNGTFTITVTDNDEFEYEITASPTTPATGTITASYTGASIEVETQDAGDDTNLLSGAQLQVTVPIAGLDTDAFVQYLGLTGGADAESDKSLLERVLYSRANPVANFNVSAITLQVLTVTGVTRVFVNPITPYVGAVTVAFMRDDDSNPIPDAGEVQDVEDAILEIYPAQSDPGELYVLAPTPVTVDFLFASITPDTPTMRTAIENSLDVFFRDVVDYETNIDEDKYRSAIINTIDLETGDTMTTFTLTSPTTDIVISTNEIGVLGTVSF